MKTGDICVKTGKVAFPTESKARKAMAAGKRADKPWAKAGSIEAIYRCKYCDGFHVSRQAKGKPKR